MGRKAQGTDITPWGVQSLGTLRDSCKGDLKMGHLSQWELCYRNLERGAPLLGALKVMKRKLWGCTSLFFGTQLGNLEWAHLMGTLRYG